MKRMSPLRCSGDMYRHNSLPRARGATVEEVPYIIGSFCPECVNLNVKIFSKKLLAFDMSIPYNKIKARE